MKQHKVLPILIVATIVWPLIAQAQPVMAGTEAGDYLGILERWLHLYGVGTVTIILTLESLGLPLPGEFLLILAAILAGRGEISFPALVCFAWAGTVTGDNI